MFMFRPLSGAGTHPWAEEHGPKSHPDICYSETTDYDLFVLGETDLFFLPLPIAGYPQMWERPSQEVRP